MMYRSTPRLTRRHEIVDTEYLMKISSKSSSFSLPLRLDNVLQGRIHGCSNLPIVSLQPYSKKVWRVTLNFFLTIGTKNVFEKLVNQIGWGLGIETI